MLKTVWDKNTRHELISRIHLLQENATAQWGKMNAGQMVRHCALWEEVMLGKVKHKRHWLGFLFGKIALKGLLGDEKPMGRNAPTISALLVKETGDFEAEKSRWISLIGEHASPSAPGIIHPFFGKITKEQIDYIIYKHTDHHLRQFNS